MSWLGRIFRRRHLYDDWAKKSVNTSKRRPSSLCASTISPALRRATLPFVHSEIRPGRDAEPRVWQWSRLESVCDMKARFTPPAQIAWIGITVLLTLAIGVGANTAVFSVVNSVLLKPLPIPMPAGSSSLSLNAPEQRACPVSRMACRSPHQCTLRSTSRTGPFNRWGIWAAQRSNVTGLARPEEVKTVLRHRRIIETLGVAPLTGRALTPADQVPNGPKTVMLSYGYWQRRFGGQPLHRRGGSIVIDSEMRTIVGVMPRGSVLSTRTSTPGPVRVRARQTTTVAFRIPGHRPP